MYKKSINIHHKQYCKNASNLLFQKSNWQDISEQFFSPGSYSGSESFSDSRQLVDAEESIDSSGVADNILSI